MEKKLLVRGKTPGQIFRILAWIVVAWLAFLFAIILIVNIPAVQTLITGYVSKLVSKKTGTEFSVGAVKISFPKTVCVGKVYLAGQKADTLLYLDELRLNVDLFQLLRNRIKVKKLLINGLVSQITRKAPENEFNFQFVLDAFATKDSLTEPEKKPSKPWIFDVQNVKITNSLVVYDDDVAGLKAQLDLGELFLQNSTLLASMALSTGDGKNSPENLHIPSDTVQNSLFPNWNITIKKIELVNTDARM